MSIYIDDLLHIYQPYLMCFKTTMNKTLMKHFSWPPSLIKYKLRLEKH